MTALVWFRRDLRLHDHPALRAALDGHERVVAGFCLDERILAGRHRSGPRTQFMLECLEDLDSSLRDRGGGLVVRHGRPRASSWTSPARCAPGRSTSRATSLPRAPAGRAGA